MMVHTPQQTRAPMPACRVPADTPPIGQSTTEQQLLDRVAAGDMAALWPLWERYHDYLYDRCLQWMGGDPTEAEDMLSNAMLKVYEHLPRRAHNITNLKAWLIRVTHNLCVDVQRSRARHPTGTEYLDEMHVPAGETLGSTLASPEQIILWHEIHKCLWRSLDDLPPHLRESLELRILQEKPYPNIAAQLGISNANVHKRVQLARELLRKRLHRHLYGRKIA